MHTIVEVFDFVNLQNNIVATLTFGAQRTVFLYEPGQEDSMEGVVSLLKEKRPSLSVQKVLVPATNAKQAVEETLARIHAQQVETLVETNGGNPIISNYARVFCRDNNMPCIMLDMAGRQIIPVEHAAALEGPFQVSELTFADILRLQGRTYNRNMHMLAEEEYFDRILWMSEYAFTHQDDFSFFYNFVHHKSNGTLSEPELTVVLEKSRDVSQRIIHMFELFEDKGFLQDFRINDQSITFTCAAPFVKEMLAVKGSWLEMYVYILAKRSGLFHEVYQSVMIGWDLDKRPRFQVENEIDVVLMKQGIPIFISCKMGNPKPDALNEIYALADSFGGYGAVAALATSADVRSRNTAFYNRAKEMGVRLMDLSCLNREAIMQFFKGI